VKSERALRPYVRDVWGTRLGGGSAARRLPPLTGRPATRGNDRAAIASRTELHAAKRRHRAEDSTYEA